MILDILKIIIHILQVFKLMNNKNYPTDNDISKTYIL